MAKKILVVDDSKAMRLIVIRTLRQAGLTDFELCEASNGVEALATVRKGGVDVVLSDWNMPEMTGIQLLESLRDDGFPGKFAFITSESTDEMRSRATTAGAHAFVTKPFTPETFQKNLSPLL